MKHLVTILLANLLVLAAGAQSFKGTVTDLDSKKPVASAYVYFIELETGTTTNDAGEFTIEQCPSKTIHIQISFIGYKTTNIAVDLATVSEQAFVLERSHVDLQEVVVSVPSGKLQGENIVSIELRKLEQLKSTAPLSLAEAISSIPGVEQTTTGAGIGKPIIRGLSGNRIVTYAQGIRVENQQWGDEHGLGIGDVGVESVEVIKGPASLLYGSDALGGVLFFVDERYANQNTVSGFASSKFLSNTLGTLNNAGIKLHKGKLKFNVFGAYASHADYEIPNGNQVFNTRFDEQNVKASLGFTHKNWITNLRYSYLTNAYGITEGDSFATVTDRTPTLPFQAIDNHNVSLENIFFAGDSKLSLVLGFSDNVRKEFEDDEMLPALNMQLQTETYNLKWHSPTFKEKLSFTVGTQGMHQTNVNSGEELLVPDATTKDLGGFTIVNLDLNALHLQGGIRVDQRWINTVAVVGPDDNIPSLSSNYGSFNYSGGAAYKLEKTAFRINLSSGFRAPNTSELLSYGIHEGTNRFELGNPTLKSENATQIDFSVDYTTEHFSFTVNPFYNSIQNFIYLSPTDLVLDDAPVYEYLQTDAVLFGGEAGIHYHPHDIHWLHTESNLSMVYAEDANQNPLPLIPAYKLQSAVKTEFSGDGKFKIKELFVQHVYKMRQSRTSIFETTTPEYHLLNAGVSLELATKNQPIEFTAGVKNLLNTQYIDHLSRLKAAGTPNQGINFYVGLKLRFERELNRAE